MLFFFELLLFILIMLTLALGEFVGKGWALTVWLAVTATVIGGYFLALGALRPLLSGASPGLSESPPSSPPEAGGDHEPEPVATAPSAEPDAPTPLDARWARTLLYNWRRSIGLLCLGALAVAGWYWLGG